MSAYMCRDDTLAYIAWCTQIMVERYDIYPDDVLQKYCYHDRMSKIGDFYKDLFEMNTRALCERYDDPSDMIQEFVPYCLVPKSKFEFNYVKLVNYLDCYLYQCAEGNVYGSDLYKSCERIQAAAAKIYIRELDEYSKHPWGAWDD